VNDQRRLGECGWEYMVTSGFEPHPVHCGGAPAPPTTGRELSATVVAGPTLYLE
jgi:hypothetical protein